MILQVRHFPSAVTPVWVSHEISSRHLQSWRAGCVLSSSSSADVSSAYWSVEGEAAIREYSSPSVLLLLSSPAPCSAACSLSVCRHWRGPGQSSLLWWGVHIPGGRYPARFMGRRRPLASRRIAAGKCELVIQQRFFEFHSSSVFSPLPFCSPACSWWRGSVHCSCCCFQFLLQL